MGTFLKQKSIFKLFTRILSFVFIISISPATSAHFYSARKADPTILPVAESVHYLDSSSGRCTATLVSNSGHFLTARHCLQRCLIQSGVFIQAENGPSGVFHFTLNSRQLGKATCDITLNDLKTSVSIEATSPGLIIKMDERSFETLAPEQFKSLVAEGYTSEGDFVIFKSSVHSGSNHCLSLTPKNNSYLNVNFTTKPELFQNIDYAYVNHHVFGYPSETFREGRHNSNGKNLYYSFGKSNPSILKNSCLKDENLTLSQQQRLTKIFDMDTSFLSTVDATYGSSGSAVFDDDHNVLGILTNTYRHVTISKNKNDEPENIFCEGSTKALKMTTIFSILEKINYEASQLSCQNLSL